MRRLIMVGSFPAVFSRHPNANLGGQGRAGWRTGERVRRARRHPRTARPYKDVAMLRTQKPRLGGMSAFPNGTPIPTPDLRRHGHICAIFDACQAPSLTEPCCLRIFQRLRSLMANSFANWVTTALIGFPSPNNSSAFTLIRLCLASVSILFILGM